MDFPFDIGKRILTRKVFGVGISGEENLMGALISNVKGDLSVDETFNDTDEIAAFLVANQTLPVILNIQSKHVITIVSEEVVNEDNFESIFEENVPNGKLEDFIIDYAGNMFAFARKSMIDELCDTIAGFSDQIVGIHLLPVSGYKLAEHLSVEDQKQEVILGGYQYSFSSGLLGDFKTANLEDLFLSNDRIPSKQVVAYLGVVHYLTRHYDPNSEVYDRREELVFKALYDRVRMPVLFSVLIILLANAVFFFIFDKKNQELSEKSRYIQQLDTRLQNVNNFIERSGQILEPADDRFSILCDQIGHYNPPGISLSRMVINPPAGRRSEQDYVESEVILEGITENASTFSRWQKRLSELPWLVKIEKQTYEHISTGSEKSKFQIIIHYDVEKLKL